MIKKYWQWCKDNQIKMLAILSVMMLVVICVPLFVVSHYNYPSADDFSFGSSIYRLMQEDATLFELLRAGFQEWKDYYWNWQGTYMATFLHVFEVGGKIPNLYCLTTYFLLGIFLLASILFYKRLFRQVFHFEKYSALFMTTVTICMQILFVPGINESFFWFVGGAAYTFFYALLLLIVFLLLKMEDTISVKGVKLCYAATIILLIMMGGGNYVTGLVTLEFLVLFLLWKILQKKKVLPTTILLIIYLIAFLCNICAPGNMVRASAHTVMSPMESIVQSVMVGLNFIKIWSHGYVGCFLILVLPFLLKGILRSNYSYKYPWLFSILSIGLFCSNLTPSIWVNGTWGGDRIVTIVYYQYYLLLLLNVAYWCGWIMRKFEKFSWWQNVSDNLQGEKIKKWLFPYIAVVGIVFAAMVIKPGYYRALNPYQAVVILKNGEAKQYAYENELRWNYLEETEETDVVVTPFSVKPALLYHEDIVEDKEDWRNYTLACFFEKKSITLRAE